jgi:hypothetical protein
VQTKLFKKKKKIIKNIAYSDPVKEIPALPPGQY